MTNAQSDSRINGSANGFGETTAKISKERSRDYPRYPIPRVEAFAKVIFNEGARNVDQENVARRAGYSNAQNGAYKSLRASVTYFGYATYDKVKGTLSLTQEWIDAFNAEDPEVIKLARQAAMRRPALYEQLIQDYANQQLPLPDKFARQLYLNPKYQIVREASEGAAKAFLESATAAGMIDDKRFLRINPQSATPPAIAEDDKPDSQDMADDQSVDVKASNNGSQIPTTPAGYVRVDVELQDGTIAYVVVRRGPVSGSDKKRLKIAIDLLRDDDDFNLQHRPAESRVVDED